jgi:1-acyl-sn-glycerol-3-phosphate acyltransferase
VAPQFVNTYRNYIKNTRHCDNHFGFDIRRLAAVVPFLQFLYNDWWRVQFTGLDLLPKEGPALIVGNSNGLIPWPAFMLMYALMAQESPRRLTIVADMDWIEDERIHSYLVELGFVPWSSTNLKYLFSKGELVAVFPEGLPSTGKPFSERYRVREFDWTRLLPAFEAGVDIYPMATIGCDEASPTFLNAENLSKLLNLPSFPVTPFFPWLPFPANLGSLPVKWKMTLLKPTKWKDAHSDRDALENTAKHHSRYVEGQIQAELNRMLRWRIKTFI